MTQTRTGLGAEPSSEALAALPDLPRDDDGPVFAEPWQAQAFALTVTLHQAGCFAWPEWAACLAAEIKAAQARGDPDLGDTYYQHWLAALERIVVDKGLMSDAALAQCFAAWQSASRATPHGQPITLPAGLVASLAD